MSFVLLDDRIRGYIISFMMLSLILSIIVLIARYTLVQDRKIRVSHILLTIINSVYIASLMELNHFTWMTNKFELSFISKVVMNTSSKIAVLFSALVTTLAITMMIKLYRNSKDNLNVFSIKEAIENLETGIAFVGEEGEILLSNHIMQNLSITLCGRVFLSGNQFYQELLAMRSNENCVIKSLDPAFMLSDEKVWQFTRKTMPLQDQTYVQILANDITVLYHLNEDTAKINEKLSEQQQRLKELTNKIEKNTEEEVALRLKVNFHDNFGNLLALTKKTLRERSEVDETKVITDYWTQLNRVLHDLSQDTKPNLSLNQIQLFASKLGCSIEINGLLPEQEEEKEVLLLCINEALKNAYRHGNAKRLMVSIQETKDKIHLKIYNEDKQAPEVIREGGGLSGLRYKVEQLGGTMNIVCDHGVIIEVTLDNAEGE